MVVIKSKPTTNRWGHARIRTRGVARSTPQLTRPDGCLDSEAQRVLLSARCWKTYKEATAHFAQFRFLARWCGGRLMFAHGASILVVGVFVLMLAAPTK